MTGVLVNSKSASPRSTEIFALIPLNAHGMDGCRGAPGLTSGLAVRTNIFLPFVQQARESFSMGKCKVYKQLALLLIN